MTEITREQAESFINNSKVLQSTVDHERNDLIVNFKLSDRRSLYVYYNKQDSLKTYYINGEQVTT